MMKFSLLAVASIPLFSISCTSATRGTSQDLPISSNVPQTKVQLSTGEVGYTPVSFQVKRKTPITIVASKPGYKTQTFISRPNAKPGAVSEAVVGSLLLWGPLNAADYFNGSLKEHQPVVLNMVR